MTQRRPFIASCAVVAAGGVLASRLGGLDPWDVGFGVLAYVSATWLVYRLQRSQDADTKEIKAAIAGLVMADPAVPNSLAPTEERTT